MVNRPRPILSLLVFLAGLCLGLLCFAGPSLAETPVMALIPKPNKVAPRKGFFTLTPETLVAVNSAQLKDIGRFLSDLVTPSTGFNLAVKSSPRVKSKAIILH